MRCDIRSCLLHLLQAVNLGSSSLDTLRHMRQTHASVVIGFNWVYLYIKTNQMHNISILFYFGTTLYMYFGRSLRPSSGV